MSCHTVSPCSLIAPLHAFSVTLQLLLLQSQSHARSPAACLPRPGDLLVCVPQCTASCQAPQLRAEAYHMSAGC